MNMDLVSTLPYRDANALHDYFLVHRFVHEATSGALGVQYQAPGTTFGLSDQQAEEAWINLMGNPDERGAQPPALRAWLDNHNQIHLNTYAVLGGDPDSAPDLSVVDFSSEAQFYDWMQLHQEVHDYEQQALGLS
jgi:hypothetical protein